MSFRDGSAIEEPAVAGGVGTAGESRFLSRKRVRNDISRFWKAKNQELLL